MKVAMLAGVFSMVMVGCSRFSPLGAGMVRGSGKVSSQTRQIGDFRKLEAGLAIDVDVIVGPKPSLQIDAEDNIIPLIESKIAGDTLTLTSTKSFSTTKPVHVIVTVPNLDAVKATGAGSIKIKGLDADKFDLDASGAGNVIVEGKAKAINVDGSGAGKVVLKGLNSDELRLKLSGAGSVQADGKTRRMDADLSGAGDLQAFDLTAVEANIRSSGAGTARITTTDTIHAKVSGAGNITYGGKPPSVSKEITGAGSIRER
jgi:hypothetical protein